MLAGESVVGLVPCACWNHHATVTAQKCGIFVAIMAAFTGFGLLLPYMTVIIRSMMPAFLPFISQAGGAPPSNGIFCFFMIIGSFFGIVAIGIFYESINQRNVKDLKRIRYSNNIGAILMIMSFLGLVVTVNNPVGYTDVPNKFEWVVTVLYEHGFGAAMILVGAAIYQYFLAVVWWYLPDTTRTEKYIKIAFAVIYFIFFLLTVYPMPAFMFEELGPNPLDFASMKNVTYRLPLEFTTNYIICAVCEWALCILSMVNFLTHFRDLQKVSVHLILRHKSCLAEVVEPAPCISLKVIK